MKKFRVKVNEREYIVEVSEEGVESVTQSVPVSKDAQSATATRNVTQSPASDENRATESSIRAPIAGKILRITKKEGEEVKRDDVVLVLEAMKMENEIYAPESGRVRKMYVKEGENVEEGQLLCEIE
jgi:biotin carboxyl carrier protein